MTCRCLDCGRDFYSEEPQAEVVEEMMEDGRLVDDEEALRAAEEAVRKQAEDERERRRWY